jgi:flagellar hook assembly protein FlgD
VQKLIIYDRFGVEQFNKEGGYTDQWEGQGSNGHTMAKGTYYYVIQQANNLMNTGWVYIN